MPSVPQLPTTRRKRLRDRHHASKTFGAWVLALAVVGNACNPGAAGIVFMPTLFNPCSYDGTLRIHLSETGYAHWGGTTVWRDRSMSEGIRSKVPGGTIEVAFIDEDQETDMKLAGTPIELYRGTKRLPISSKRESPRRSDGGCGYAQITSFDLSKLEPGSYTLVHRRTSGVNNEVDCGQEACKWTTFDGEAALVTTLVIPAPEDLPRLTRDELESKLAVEKDRLRSCYQTMAGKLGHKPKSEEVIVDLRIVSDRAYGMAERPLLPRASEPFAHCIDRALSGLMRFDTHPLHPILARLRFAVTPDVRGFEAASVDVALIEWLITGTESPHQEP